LLVARKGRFRDVERLLYRFPALKAFWELEQEYFFPSITAKFSHAPKGHNMQNTTEEYGLKRTQKWVEYKAVQRALESLSDDERKLVETRYFTHNVQTDIAAWLALSMSERKYYRIKHRALEKMAIIIEELHV
jgi:ArpU family phage transcriptional regulator